MTTHEHHAQRDRGAGGGAAREPRRDQRTTRHSAGEQRPAAPRRSTTPPPRPAGAARCAATATIHQRAPARRPSRTRCPSDRQHEGRAARRAARARWPAPTAGATSRLATTATRLTWPDSAATTGVQASCAASGTATASAAQRGSQRAQRVPEGRRQEEDAGGGQHRQREAGRQRQPRVDEQQHQRGHPERPDARLPAVRAHPDQRDRAHRRRPHARSARAGPPARTRPRRARRPPAARGPATPAHRASSSSEPDHQGEVGARHRGQVGQPAGPEVLDDLRRHLPVVPGDQGRHQRARPRRLLPASEPGPRPAPPRRPSSTLAGGRHDLGRTPGGQHRRRSPGRRRRQPSGHLDRRAERDARPSPRRRSPAPAPQRGERRARGRSPASTSSRTSTKSPKRPSRRTGSRGRPRPVSDDHGALLGQPRHRAVRFAVEPHQRRRADRGSGQHAAGEQPTPARRRRQPTQRRPARAASTAPARPAEAPARPAVRPAQPAAPSSTIRRSGRRVAGRRRSVRRVRAGPRGHTVTCGAISASVASPMPETSSSSSTALNAPCSVAPLQDRRGGHRPDPGQRLELGLVGGVEVAPGRPVRRRPPGADAAGRPHRPATGTPTTTCSPSTRTRARLSALRSTPRRGATRRLDGVDHPRPGGQHARSRVAAPCPATSTTTSAAGDPARRRAAPVPATGARRAVGRGGHQRGGGASVTDRAGTRSPGSPARRAPGEHSHHRGDQHGQRREVRRHRSGPALQASPATGPAASHPARRPGRRDARACRPGRPRGRRADRRPAADRVATSGRLAARRTRPGPSATGVCTGSGRIAASSALSSSSRRRATSAACSLAASVSACAER